MNAGGGINLPGLGSFRNLDLSAQGLRTGSIPSPFPTSKKEITLLKSID